jgi:hypothetical protein
LLSELAQLSILSDSYRTFHPGLKIRLARAPGTRKRNESFCLFRCSLTLQRFAGMRLRGVSTVQNSNIRTMHFTFFSDSLKFSTELTMYG